MSRSECARRLARRCDMRALLIVAMLAGPAAASPRWREAPPVPRGTVLTNLSIAPGRDLVGGANDDGGDKRTVETGAQVVRALRLHRGRWRATTLFEGGRHAEEVLGVWWRGDTQLALAWNPHADTGAVLRSTDGVRWTAATWDDPNGGSGDTMRDGVPAIAGDVVLAPARSDGIARSLDGGATWTMSAPFDTFAVWGASPIDLFALALLHGTIVVARSTDRGDTWAVVAPRLDVDPVALAGSSGAELYVLGTDEHGAAALLRSTDEGSTWTRVALPAGAQAGSQTLFVAGPSTLWIGGAGVWRSTDAGATWTAEPLPAGAYPIVTGDRDTLAVVRRADDRDHVLTRAR